MHRIVKQHIDGPNVMHAYSMKGCARERYILFLALLAIAFIAIAKHTAGAVGVTISIGTTTVFGAAFYIFDRYAWRWPLISNIVAIPNLAGAWEISGRTSGADGQERDWNAKAWIDQSWSQIAISVETGMSRSRSGLAAVEQDAGHGVRLIYGYTNELKSPKTELRSHRGTCEVVFRPDLQTGQGTYFTDHQRRTVGEMCWKRISNDGPKN